MIWFHVVVTNCLGLAAYSLIFLKSFSFFNFFFVFFRSYSFLFAVLWWPVQCAFVAFLVTWNKYDDDEEDDISFSLHAVMHMRCNWLPRTRRIAAYRLVWLRSHAGWLPRIRDQLRNPRLVSSIGLPLSHSRRLVFVRRLNALGLSLDKRSELRYSNWWNKTTAPVA